MTTLPIHGDRIVIDRLVPADALALARSHSDVDNARYQDWAYPLSEIEARGFILEVAQTEPFEPADQVQLAIRDRAGGLLVGDLYLYRSELEPWAVEVGITLVPGAGGQGRARRAITAAVDACFTVDDDHGPVHRVIGRLDAENDRSRRLFEDLGFRREAHHCRSLRRRGGRFPDELVFAVTADRWRQGSRHAPVLDAAPHAADIEFLDDRIYEFNMAATGYRDGLYLSAFCRDEIGRIEAGVYGWTWGGAAEVRTLSVREDLRGRAMGSTLLAAFEGEAHRRGCRRVFVSSHTFQAPAFYERHGYRRGGEWHDYPVGHGQVFLEKTLAGDD